MKKSLSSCLLLAALSLSVPACLAQGQGWGFTPGPSYTQGQAAGDGGAILSGTAGSGLQGYQTIDGTQYDKHWTQNNQTGVWGPIQPPSNTQTTTTPGGFRLQSAVFNKGTPGGQVTSTQLLAPRDVNLKPVGGSKAGSYMGGFGNPGQVAGWGGTTGMGKYWGGAMQLPPTGLGTCTGAINITSQDGAFSP